MNSQIDSEPAKPLTIGRIRACLDTEIAELKELDFAYEKLKSNVLSRHYNIKRELREAIERKEKLL